MSNNRKTLGAVLFAMSLMVAVEIIVTNSKLKAGSIWKLTTQSLAASLVLNF